MKTSLIIRAVAVVILATLSLPAMATYPNPEGTFNNPALTATEFCTPPPADPDEQSNVTVVVSNFDSGTGNFDLTVTSASLDGGETINYTGSGYFTSPSEVSVMFSGTNEIPTTENWSGTLGVSPDGNTLTVISLSGTEVGGPMCTFVVDPGQTLKRTNAPINPGTSTGAAVLQNANTLSSTTTTFVNNNNTRINNALNTLKAKKAGNKVTGLSRTHGMYEVNTGLSAGDDLDLVMTGFWASYSYTDFENDFFRTKYDGDRHMFMGGVDFSPHEDSILGISFGWEDADVDTDFNGGEAESDGFTVSPYFGMIIDDTWNMDLSAGYSNIDTDQHRLALVGGAPVGARITSDVSTERWFFAGNLNGFTQQGNWLLSGRAGGLYATSKNDDYLESDGSSVASQRTKLSQVSLGGEAAYAMGDFEPYISGTYSYDLMSEETVLTAGRQPANDDDDFMLGLGFRYYSKDNLSITAEYTNRMGRDDYDEETISLNARWDF